MVDSKQGFLKFSRFSRITSLQFGLHYSIKVDLISVQGFIYR